MNAGDVIYQFHTWTWRAPSQQVGHSQRTALELHTGVGDANAPLLSRYKRREFWDAKTKKKPNQISENNLTTTFLYIIMSTPSEPRYTERIIVTIAKLISYFTVNMEANYIPSRVPSLKLLAIWPARLTGRHLERKNMRLGRPNTKLPKPRDLSRESRNV